jgi:transcriptional regulator with XRE-family HTH domain
VNAAGYEHALGRKIATERRRRGLSQAELARIIGRSVAWVSQVERGVRRIDRMTVLETVARALDVPLSELAAEAPVVAAVTMQPQAAIDLRLVLSGAHALRAMLDGRSAPEPDVLRGRVETAWELTHGGRYAELSDLLARLIPDLEDAARALPDGRRPAAFELLAAVYQACSAALAKLGEPEAAWIAADRAMSAAERAGQPLLVGAGAFRLVFVFLAARHYGQAEETARTAADALRRLADEGQPEAMALWGALTLQRAVTAARVNRPDAAYAHLDQARDMAARAARAGERRNHYNTEFGPANVTLHEIAVAVELGDAGRALRAAAAVDPSTLSPERRARMLIDVARAHTQRRQVDQAVAALCRADELTPEQVRGHGLVRRLVSDLLAMQDPADGDLSALAARLGIPAGTRPGG